MKPGIYNMPEADYFAIEAASNSKLKAISRSPAHLKAANRPPTAAMLAGTSIHCAILEPEKFLSTHAVIPEDAPRKPTAPQIKAYEEGRPTEKAEMSIRYWTQWDAMNEGKLIITNEQSAEFQRIGNSVRNHPELSQFFNTGKAEQVVIANDPVTGVLCKCKPDYLTKILDNKIILEVKSCEDARKYPFQRTAYKYGYFQGAAFYTDVMDWSIGKPDLYLMIALERDEPYGIQIYEVPPWAIERGREEYRESLNLYAECVKTDQWPSYSTDIQILDYPYPKESP